jgi:hypothetical protein
MSTTLLSFSSLAYYPTLTARFCAEAWWTCYSSPPHTWRKRLDVVLATGEPFSVIVPAARNFLDLEIVSAPAWKGIWMTWLGIPCQVGRVTLWLPSHETPGQMRSFSLLALFPQQDVPDTPPFIQLGVQFLLEYNIQVVLNETGPGGGKRLLIP